jgi:hypothetical protein
MAKLGERDVPALVARYALWALVIVAAIVVALMAWHPWVHPWFGVPRS